MADDVERSLFDWFTYAWTGAVGALTVMLLGNRLRAASESSNKRKRFRGFITLLRRRIAAKTPGEFSYEPAAAKDAISLDREILEVRHYIQERLVARLDAAGADYKAVAFNGWAGPDVARQQTRDASNERSKTQLLFCLDELSKCAWWAV